MAKSTKKKTAIPPSLQPRKRVKKSIPTSTPEVKKTVSPPTPKVVEKKVIAKPIKPTPKAKEEKERFTLWLSTDVYQAFKIHTAIRKGSASDYIEYLIKKDLKI